MLNFEDFVKSKRIMTNAQLADFCGCDEESFEGNLANVMYADSCYIEIMSTGVYSMVIGTHSAVDKDLSVLERNLYDNWYVTECN